MDNPQGKTAKEELEEKKVEELILYLRSLGLEQLARDVSEERFMQRVLDARISYDYHSLQAEIWKDRQEKALEFAVSAQASLFDKSANYNNLVTTLGYAGFFSVWSLVSDELSRTENAFVGFFLGLSLLLFIIWTLSNSFILTMNVKRYAVIAGTAFDTFEDELNAHKLAEDKTKRAVLRAQRFWPLVFFVTTLTGLLAGLTVITELFFQIMKIEFNLVDKVVGWLQ